MSRQDRIGAMVLGLLLFAGLFYFIYTTMKSPLPADFGDETLSGDNFNTDEETVAEEENTEEDTSLSTGTASAPAAKEEALIAPTKGKK